MQDEITDFGCEGAESLEHVASTHRARPVFKQLNQASGIAGIVEIDGDVNELMDSDDEEVFDQEIWSELNFVNPCPPTVCVMETDKREAEKKQLEPFDTTKFAHVTFCDMEKFMTPLTSNGSVCKLIVRQGNGLGKIPDRCKIFYHYISVAEGQVEPFDTSLARKMPSVSDLRNCCLMPGFKIALRSMEIGEVSRFIVHPKMAFGKLGVPPRIPANSKILYVIQMLQKIDEDRLKALTYMTSEEREQLPFEEIVKESLKLRSEGNAFYKEQNYQFAIRKWRKSISLLEDYPGVDAEGDKRRSDVLWTLYSNMAQGYLKMDKPAQACNACKFGLKIVDEANSTKLLFRFAQAKLMLKDADAALGHVEQGLRIDPQNPDLQNLGHQIAREKKKQQDSYKDLCKRMLGTKLNISSPIKVTDENTPSTSASCVNKTPAKVRDAASGVSYYGVKTEKKKLTGTIEKEPVFFPQDGFDDEDLQDFCYCEDEDMSTLSYMDTLPPVFSDPPE